MANFDNGLPPASTDMTGKCVSNVSIRSDETENISSQTVQAVRLLHEEVPASQAQLGVKAVSIKSQPTGKNLVLFYL